MATRSVTAVVLGSLLFFLSFLAIPRAQTGAPVAAERVDLDAIGLIKAEGLQRSQVMDLVWYLTDVHGPRLTNSPQIRAAAKWAAEQLSSWGLSNVREDPWPFGRGWVNEQFAAQVIAPTVSPLLAYPRPWTPGTNGAVTADVVLAVVNNEQDMAKFRGRLRGKMVLIFDAVDVPLPGDPQGLRLTEQDLVRLQEEPVRGGRGRGRAGNAPAGPAPDPDIRLKRMTFYQAEGVVAALIPGNGRGDRGVVLTGGYEIVRDPKSPEVVPQVYVATEQYNRLARLVGRDIPVRVSIEMNNRFISDTLDAFNLIAEIPGTDKADEVVMLGAHFDSESAGTGATDNAAGSAAMMEAMRILKASGVRLRRTVRLALWTGEEQGLLGSTAYVTRQFADAQTMQLTPAHQKLSVYFNMDNGAGAIRGVYLQGNEAARPVFEAWMDPLKSLGMSTLAIRSVGATDHAAFDRVGLPGFQFIQDRLEYNGLSHHSNMDVFDRVQPEDMMKNAVIIASFAYQAANREERVPRKALPQPRGGRGGGS